MKRKHANKMDEYNAYRDPKRPKIETEPVVRRVTCPFSQQKFKNNVTRCVVENQLSLRIVENGAFRKMFDGIIKLLCVILYGHENYTFFNKLY